MGQRVGATVIFCHQPTSCCLRRIHVWLYKQMDLPCQNYHLHWQPLKSIRGHDKAQIPACSYRQKCSEQHRTSPACMPACMNGWHWHHQPISTVSITLFHLKEYLSSCSNLPPTQPTGKRKAKSDAYQTRRQQVPMNCLTRSLAISNELWRLLKKRAHQAGSHPSQLQNMALIYIKELLEMPSVSGMSGNHHTCHQTVCICGKQYTIEHAENF